MKQLWITKKVVGGKVEDNDVGDGDGDDDAETNQEKYSNGESSENIEHDVN